MPETSIIADDVQADRGTCKLLKCVADLSEEYNALHSGEIAIIESVPSSTEFLRRWVSRNIPVIIKNAVSHWPALRKWNASYLKSKLTGKKITVSVTPNGYADAVFSDMFMLPDEKIMTFEEFLDVMKNPKSSEVCYVQKQNNNFLEEFSSLIDDADAHIPWATEALDRHPDAVNFWMGDKRAVTSLHKDHYENIYCVVKGQKEFILHPPTDAAWIPYETYKVGAYRFENERCTVRDMNQEVKWIPVDPLKPDYEKYPLYKKVKSFHCVVEEGDALYLPSLWFHHVRQSHSCIAVNYWYDMDFDIKYCYFKFLEKIGELCNKSKDYID